MWQMEPEVDVRAAGWADPAATPPVANVPNAITLVRTVVAMGLAVAAIVTASVPLLVAAYLCYWIGDMLDGLSARWLRRETRLGAVFDILSDRACCALCAAALLMLRPDMAVPIGIFLVQFMVIDCLLSLAFLRWPLLSPNYFGQVHTGVYRWNWSPPAKAVNTSALILLVLFAPSAVYPTLLALVILGIKIASLVVVGRLTPAAPPAGETVGAALPGSVSAA